MSFVDLLPYIILGLTLLYIVGFLRFPGLSSPEPEQAPLCPFGRPCGRPSVCVDMQNFDTLFSVDWENNWKGQFTEDNYDTILEIFVLRIRGIVADYSTKYYLHVCYDGDTDPNVLDISPEIYAEATSRFERGLYGPVGVLS